VCGEAIFDHINSGMPGHWTTRATRSLRLLCVVKRMTIVVNNCPCTHTHIPTTDDWPLARSAPSRLKIPAFSRCCL